MELTDLRSNQLLPPGGSPQGETTQVGLGGTLGGRPLCCATVTETRVIRADTTSSMKPPVFIKPPRTRMYQKTVMKITCRSFASRHPGAGKGTIGNCDSGRPVSEKATIRKLTRHLVV